jgi:hypothetical protein
MVNKLFGKFLKEAVLSGFCIHAPTFAWDN